MANIVSLVAKNALFRAPKFKGGTPSHTYPAQGMLMKGMQLFLDQCTSGGLERVYNFFTCLISGIQNGYISITIYDLIIPSF